MCSLGTRTTKRSRQRNENVPLQPLFLHPKHLFRQLRVGVTRESATVFYVFFYANPLYNTFSVDSSTATSPLVSARVSSNATTAQFCILRFLEM